MNDTLPIQVQAFLSQNADEETLGAVEQAIGDGIAQERQRVAALLSLRDRFRHVPGVDGLVDLAILDAGETAESVLQTILAGGHRPGRYGDAGGLAR